MVNDFLRKLGTRLPILQAPMAGVATPALAAAVSEAGGLGGLGFGAASAAAAAAAIADTRARTAFPFNVNFFCHGPGRRDAATERAWIDRAAPLFGKFAARPPETLRDIYRSFRDDDTQLAMLLETRPAVASFHFGVPRPAQVQALRQAGIVLMASATSLAEARSIEKAGLDAVIAQGWEAGGHRGIFDPDGADGQLSTEALTRKLAAGIGLPVIAAGGLMDGAALRRALSWGAIAGQMGTAFVACPESAADAAYRARLAEGGETVMTSGISGRPARCLANLATAWSAGVPPAAIPAYPCAYDLSKALNAAAKAAGESGYGAQWAGTNVAAVHPLPAATLVGRLALELAAA